MLNPHFWQSYAPLDLAGMVRLGKLIRFERLSRGWSKRELAERSTMSLSWISAVERGRLNGTTEAALARVLGALAREIP